MRQKKPSAKNLVGGCDVEMGLQSRLHVVGIQDGIPSAGREPRVPNKGGQKPSAPVKTPNAFKSRDGMARGTPKSHSSCCH